MDLVKRFLGNLLPLTLLALAGTVLLFMSNDGCGDRPQDFRATSITLGIGFLVAILFSGLVKSPEMTAKIRYGIQIAIRYFLAYEFMLYGVAKVLDLQFASSLIYLDSRLVDLTPMQTVWAFFGYTYSYQAFVGWGEIAAAVLLCFRRTTTLGAIAFVMMISNVVLVNVFYDVCVKLNSSIYLVMALYILLLDFKRLWAYFIANTPVSPRRYPTLTQHQTIYRTFTILRYLFILFILTYPIYEAIQAKKEYRVGERSALYGAWQIDQLKVVPAQRDSAAVDPSETWGHQWEKIIFDTATIGGASGPDGMDYFSFALDTTQHTVTLTFFRDPTLNLTGLYDLPSTDRLELTGLNEQDSVHVTLSLLEKYLKPRR